MYALIRVVLLINCVSLCLLQHIEALDYYWVGGSGNWSDLSHWVTSSGGTINHDQIPTAADNVFFDANSSAGAVTIVLDLDNVFCADLDFRMLTTPLTLRGPKTTTLNLFGSLFLRPQVTLDFAGSFDFRATGPGNSLGLCRPIAASDQIPE